MQALPPALPVVLAASAPWRSDHPVNAHHVARRLAARGHRVLFVESTGLRSPRLSWHDLSRIGARLRAQVETPSPGVPGLSLASPLALPWGWPGPFRRVSQAWIARSVRREAARLGMERPVLWSFLPTLWPLARALDARATVYHCVDHYAGNPGVPRAFVEASEARMLAEADLVYATSPVLAQRLAEHRPDVRCVPNVADVALFGEAVRQPPAAPPELASLPRPRAIYTGNLAAYRIDAELLHGAADAVGEGSLVLVGASGLGDVDGPPPGWQALLARPQVHLLGPRPYAALPAYLAHSDVALVPFLDNEHTRGSLPLKLWEYLAAGRAVVARDLPNFTELAAEGWIRLAGNRGDFAAAVRAALAEPVDRASARLARASQHDWEARMDELCAGLADVLAGKSG